MKLQIVKATTSQRVGIFVQDSSATDGSGLTGLLFNTASLAWYYWREDEGDANATQVTLATATRGTWATGGFIEKDATNLPGFYEISIPDAALATGAGWVVMRLGGAANMAPLTLEIQLTTLDMNTVMRGTDSGIVKTDTIAELAQGVPATTPTIETLLMFLYHIARDRFDIDNTSGFKEVYNDAGTVIAKKAITDSGTVYSEAKAESGP